MANRVPLLRGLSIAAAAIVLSGCNNCEKLVEKTCGELGPDDCAYWKQHGWDQKMIPGGRGVNSFCGKMMGDGVYPQILEGQKKLVKVTREADAKRAKAK